MVSSPAAPARRSARRFATTRWSLVLEARGPCSQPARVAMEELCRAYWLPVFAFILSDVRSEHDAQDLTQGFFVTLLEHDTLQTVHPERGRFRSFLLAAVRHFLSNERDRANALKRGGQATFVSLDQLSTDSGIAAEIASGEAPEDIFERRWALSLLVRVMQRLADECTTLGRAALFAALSGRLTSHDDDHSLIAIAETLSMSVSNVRTSLHRLRKRYRALLREEVAQTTDSPDAVDDEIRHLFRALQGSASRKATPHPPAQSDP